MIKAENIVKKFSHLTVLKGINFEVEKGEIVSIVGPSGAGKTTLLQIIGTLMRADSGKIIINNEEISTLNQKKIAQFRNKNIGFVFQFHQLLPEFTALENVCIPALIAGKSKKKVRKEAMRLIEYLNMQHRADHKPSEMSGGEQQRIAVARALINEPAVILADEPSGNLDSENKKDLHQLFLNLRKEYEQTFVVVTHNDSLANISDRVIKLKDGIIED